MRLELPPPPLTYLGTNTTFYESPQVSFLHTITPPKPLELNSIPQPKDLDLNAIPKPAINMDYKSEYSCIKLSSTALYFYYFEANTYRQKIESNLVLLKLKASRYRSIYYSILFSLHFLSFSITTKLN